MKAFPNPTLSDTQNNSSDRLNDESEYGMDLRDYFAAKAMQGILSGDRMIATSKLEIRDVCEVAYRYADALMEARND